MTPDLTTWITNYLFELISVAAVSVIGYLVKNKFEDFTTQLKTISSKLETHELSIKDNRSLIDQNSQKDKDAYRTFEKALDEFKKFNATNEERIRQLEIESSAKREVLNGINNTLQALTSQISAIDRDLKEFYQNVEVVRKK